jgi:drug/metabolite transporter (DMT)-like permease
VDVPHIGEAAALATSLLWAFTSIFFTLASGRIGALEVNRLRLLMAVLLLGASHAALTGDAFPRADWASWLWLGASGLVGLTVGDTLLFQSLVELGPRRAMLVMSSWPIFSALLAFLFFGELLSATELLGIACTVGGIAWVIRERNPGAFATGGSHTRGVLCALGGAACQALGLVLAKQGLASGLAPLPGTLIRMIVAAAGLWAVTLAAGRAGRTVSKLRDRRALLFTSAGAVTGPFLGVWMSLLAVSRAKVGVASALMALVPILLLPIVRVVFAERVSLRAVLGTLLSFVGVLLLFIK